MTHVVIMAGGVGSRFWPMSTADNPKQFIDVLGVGRSLLQLTFDRFANICKPENVWVVTNADYVEKVHQQLPLVPEKNILSEPCRRNTAPCIAYVSHRIKSECQDANIVVTPSDHVVLPVHLLFDEGRLCQSISIFLLHRLPPSLSDPKPENRILTSRLSASCRTVPGMSLPSHRNSYPHIHHHGSADKQHRYPSDRLSCRYEAAPMPGS